MESFNRRNIRQSRSVPKSFQSQLWRRGIKYSQRNFFPLRRISPMNRQTIWQANSHNSNRNLLQRRKRLQSLANIRPSRIIKNPRRLQNRTRPNQLSKLKQLRQNRIQQSQIRQIRKNRPQKTRSRRDQINHTRQPQAGQLRRNHLQILQERRIQRNRIQAQLRALHKNPIRKRNGNQRLRRRLSGSINNPNIRRQNGQNLGVSPKMSPYTPQELLAIAPIKDKLMWQMIISRLPADYTIPDMEFLKIFESSSLPKQ